MPSSPLRPGGEDVIPIVRKPKAINRITVAMANNLTRVAAFCVPAVCGVAVFAGSGGAAEVPVVMAAAS
jgi:hypothetical protein